MNNRLYEYMRLGREEDEKRYQEELFDTKKITKLSDSDIKKYNESSNNASKKSNSKVGTNKASQSTARENNKENYIENNNSYIDNYYAEEDSGNNQISNDIDNGPSTSYLSRISEKVKHNNNNILGYGDNGNKVTGNEEKTFYHYRSPFSRAKKAAVKVEPKPSDYNNIDGKTMLMGLIGEEVSNSLLPWVHREIAVTENYNYSYNAFGITRNNLEDAVNAGITLGIKGFNVAEPYREEIIPYLKAIGKSAYLIGYVNTLVYKEDGYYGFNTEISGIKKTLIGDKVSVKDKNVLITGTHNMISSIMLAMCEMNARNIVVITSDKDKIERFASRIGAAYEGTNIHILSVDDDYMYEINQLTTIKNFKLVCFYTGQDMPDDNDLYERIEVGYDISYDEAISPFMNRVLMGEGAADNGLKMYINRALSAYELWSGKKAGDEIVEYIYKKLKKKIYNQ